MTRRFPSATLIQLVEAHDGLRSERQRGSSGIVVNGQCPSAQEASKPGGRSAARTSEGVAGCVMPRHRTRLRRAFFRRDEAKCRCLEGHCVAVIVLAVALNVAPLNDPWPAGSGCFRLDVGHMLLTRRTALTGLRRRLLRYRSSPTMRASSSAVCFLILQTPGILRRSLFFWGWHWDGYTPQRATLA